MFLLLTLNIFHTFFSVSIVDFEQVNVNWVGNTIQQNFGKLRLNGSDGWVFPSRIYFIKVNNWNTKTMCEIWLKLTVVLVSLFLTLSRFHTLFWCFLCWLWTSKSRHGWAWVLWLKVWKQSMSNWIDINMYWNACMYLIGSEADTTLKYLDNTFRIEGEKTTNKSWKDHK